MDIDKLKDALERAIMTNGDYPEMLENLRLVCSLWHRYDLPETKAFLNAYGVECQVDEIPLGSAREIWNPEALEKIDVDARDWLLGQQKLIDKSLREMLASLPEEL